MSNSPVSLSVVSLFMHADIVVKGVLLLLLAASVWSWAVIIDKLWRLGRGEPLGAGARGAGCRGAQRARPDGAVRADPAAATRPAPCCSPAGPRARKRGGQRRRL